MGTEGTPAGSPAPAAAPAASPTADLGIAIPGAWAESETFKPYFKDGDNGAKSFDFDTLTKDVTNYRQNSTAIPKTADEYQLPYPQDWVLGQDDVKAVREAAKQAGMTQAQAEAWVKHDLARLSRGADEAAAELQKAKQDLGKEWKNDFDKNLGLAKRVADSFFGPEWAKKTDLGNSPDLIRGLFKIAKQMGEDVLKMGGGPAGSRPIGEDGRPRLKFPSMGD